MKKSFLYLRCKHVQKSGGGGGGGGGAVPPPCHYFSSYTSESSTIIIIWYNKVCYIYVDLGTVDRGSEQVLLSDQL